jgi:RimJ/RimL family protein N-acetyltransferase
VDAPTLTDGLVTLRMWCAEDGDWYAYTVRDPLIQRYTTEQADLTGQRVRDAIADLAVGPDRVGWVICAAGTGERWGNLALERRGPAGHVSYWLAPGARGRGAATAALRLMADWARATSFARELALWTHAQNAQSRAVAERAGFRRAPDRDGERVIKGERWTAVWYVLPLQP